MAGRRIPRYLCSDHQGGVGAIGTVLAAFNQLSSWEELQELRCRYPRCFLELAANRRAGPRGLGGKHTQRDGMHKQGVASRTLC